MGRNIIRLAQEAPGAIPPPIAPPAAPPMPDPLAGGLGMPPAPMGAPTAPMAPATGTVSSQGMRYPLESSGMILMDAEVEKRLKEQFASTEHINTTSEQEIANEIWMEYGGNELGGVDKEKRGKRVRDEEVDDQEIKATRDRKWERLPLGKNLSDLGITLEDFSEMISAWSQGIAANKKKEAPAGGGGGMGLASRNYKQLIRTAQILDNLGLYNLADDLI